VESFSKINAISLPHSCGTSVPAYLAALRAAASFSRKAISRGVKSLKVRKCLLFRLKAMVRYPCRSESVTYGWATHAATTAAATAQLRARHLQHLDSGRLQCSIGVVIAVIADDDTRAKRQYVVAIIPLLALTLGGCIPTSGHHYQRVDRKSTRLNS